MVVVLSGESAGVSAGFDDSAFAFGSGFAFA